MSKRILVIDDDAYVSRMVARYLQDAGYLVDTAADGREGMKCFHAHRHDLIVTDLVMPEQEGIETIAQVRAEGTPVRIIAMSGAVDNSNHTYLVTAEMLGADRVFTKPLDTEAFMEAVLHLIGPSGAGG